jgi:hypothetical protein
MLSSSTEEGRDIEECNSNDFLAIDYLIRLVHKSICKFPGTKFSCFSFRAKLLALSFSLLSDLINTQRSNNINPWLQRHESAYGHVCCFHSGAHVFGEKFESKSLLICKHLTMLLHVLNRVGGSGN